MAGGGKMGASITFAISLAIMAGSPSSDAHWTHRLTVRAEQFAWRATVLGVAAGSELNEASADATTQG
nr:hypothetical protein [Polyangium spumosum]